MMSEQEVVIEESQADYECPSCHTLLTIYYDEKARYVCENCDEELSRFDLNMEDGDNNISTGFSDRSSRRLF